MNKITIVVTGSSGYIGGQTSLLLKDAGYEVYGIDLVQPSAPIAAALTNFCRCDFVDKKTFDLIDSVKPTAIIHCAGTSLVGPSIMNPEVYYYNNFAKTLILMNHLVNSKSTARVIFSSSAAVYGDPVMTPCQEEDPATPISPYGESKLMVEMMLASYCKAYNVDYVAFRYFNACGADPQGRHGQAPNGTHIIARVLESIRDGKQFTLYGTDYPTADGSCIRDYVHVEDIARAHMSAIDPKVDTGVYNLGLNKGVSNLEIIRTAERITEKKLEVVTGEKRDGDPAELTANASKFGTAVGEWRQHTLDNMIQHAWTWYNK
jgi:UDP-glucose 4-epimerase